MSEIQQPFVSVVVAVRNGARTLERCLDSISRQNYAARELIVMDGGSTDGSVEILEAKNASIDYWESEPDRGIAHAWNKALWRASGDWVSFLGCDDYFFGPDSLATLVNAGGAQQTDLVSSRVALVDDAGRVQRYVGSQWAWERMKRFQNVAHPGMLHRRSLFERLGPFDEGYTIAVDYEWLLRLGPAGRVAFVDETLLCAGGGGKSRTMLVRVLTEGWRAQVQRAKVGVVPASLNLLSALARTGVRRALGLT